MRAPLPILAALAGAAVLLASCLIPARADAALDMGIGTSIHIVNVQRQDWQFYTIREMPGLLLETRWCYTIGGPAALFWHDRWITLRKLYIYGDDPAECEIVSLKKVFDVEDQTI